MELLECLETRLSIDIRPLSNYLGQAYGSRSLRLRLRRHMLDIESVRAMQVVLLGLGLRDLPHRSVGVCDTMAGSTARSLLGVGLHMAVADSRTAD